MHPAARLQFERMIGEYARWRAVPEKERSPAPAWWWGPAMELRNAPQPLPAEWCAELGLPDHATCDFPRKTEIPDAKEVRELHPQPSDDSAFQP